MLLAASCVVSAQAVSANLGAWRGAVCADVAVLQKMLPWV
jgi:hypothetical protein